MGTREVTEGENLSDFGVGVGATDAGVALWQAG
jgi:hypothetical protein